MRRHPQTSPLFPYTTPSRSEPAGYGGPAMTSTPEPASSGFTAIGAAARQIGIEELRPEQERAIKDRKSTRLNSSHLVISYAVFCLKKKNKWTNYNCRNISHS